MLPEVLTAKTQYNLKNAKEYFEAHLCVGAITMKDSAWPASGSERVRSGLDCPARSAQMPFCGSVKTSTRSQVRRSRSGSRPLPCSVRRPSGFVLTGPRRSRSRMRTPRRAAGAESLRELNGIVHRYHAKFSVGHSTGICSQAKDDGILSRKLLSECGAVREVSMNNLFQLGMRNAKFSASNSCHVSNDGMLKRVAKRVSHCRRH
jgi:hypothetical protein